MATDGAKVPDNFVKLEPKASLHGLPVDTGVEEVMCLHSSDTDEDDV